MKVIINGNHSLTSDYDVSFAKYDFDEEYNCDQECSCDQECNCPCNNNYNDCVMGA